MDNFELQQGLNTVVTNKVQRMIAGRQQTVQQTMERLICEGRIAQDFIAPIGVEQRRQGARPTITFAAEHHLSMNMPQGSYTIHSNAVGQLAEKMGVPSKYLRELSEGSEWQRSLAANILNEHSGWSERTRVLVRSVGTEVRGILSDSKVFVETILPQPVCIPTRFNGEVVVYMGARFSTSDYGDGAIDMRAFLLNGACLNGMVRESIMKQIHLGAKLPDNLQLSERTYQLDTRTTMSAVKDFTKNLYSADNIREKAHEIQQASEVEVDFDNELRKLVKNNKLLKTESEGVQKLLMNNNPDDGVQGGATLWKLTQAITAHARDLDPRRSRELHEVSGELIARVAA